MQTITADFIKAYIKSNKIKFTPTQPKLCVPIISRMCRKMFHGIKFDHIKVSDNLIIDGHHRYLSAVIMGFELGHVPSNSTSATIKTAWEFVEFDEVDWDTPERIAILNRLDAQYNNLGIEFVNQITFP